MAYLTPKDELKVKQGLQKFLKQRFNCSVKRYYVVIPNFAPHYYLKKSKKKRIVIFRNPPTFPEVQINEIKTIIQNKIGVYLAVYNHEFDPLLESLLSKCESLGIGVIQCSSTHRFEILQPSIVDYPKPEKIIESRIKFFVSSKLWMPEREKARKVLIKYKHQPICVERISNQGQVEKVCFDWIDKSSFFIGILTPHYRPIVDKEIRYALRKKKKKCLVYIRTDCLDTKNRKLKGLIEHVRKNTIYHKFSSEKEIKEFIPDHAAYLISKHSNLQ